MRVALLSSLIVVAYSAIRIADAGFTSTSVVPAVVRHQHITLDAADAQTTTTRRRGGGPTRKRTHGGRAVVLLPAAGSGGSSIENGGASENDATGRNRKKEEAEKYLAKARALREEALQKEEVVGSLSQEPRTPSSRPPPSPWNVVAASDDVQGGIDDYRLYVDIGREDGTWMDPRWGASGKRIEFTLDVRFVADDDASQEAARRMVRDNLGGKRQAVRVLEAAAHARLRGGFDRMRCDCGAYRIDAGNKPGVGTVRFYVAVAGIGSGEAYGDVSIPEGCLYFSLPVFGNSTSNLSTKEGIVSVRQMGWHTGWRREESRIVGTFRAVPIEKAKRIDGF